MEEKMSKFINSQKGVVLNQLRDLALSIDPSRSVVFLMLPSSLISLAEDLFFDSVFFFVFFFFCFFFCFFLFFYFIFSFFHFFFSFLSFFHFFISFTYYFFHLLFLSLISFSILENQVLWENSIRNGDAWLGFLSSFSISISETIKKEKKKCCCLVLKEIKVIQKCFLFVFIVCFLLLYFIVLL